MITLAPTAQVEAPPLSIIVPLLVRGLRERTTAIKRKACVIIDNMAKLVDVPWDAAPFLPKLIPELEKVCARSAAVTAMKGCVLWVGDGVRFWVLLEVLRSTFHSGWKHVLRLGLCRRLWVSFGSRHAKLQNITQEPILTAQHGATSPTLLVAPQPQACTPRSAGQQHSPHKHNIFPS